MRDKKRRLSGHFIGHQQGDLALLPPKVFNLLKLFTYRDLYYTSVISVALSVFLLQGCQISQVKRQEAPSNVIFI